MNDQPPKLELKHGPPLFEGFTLQMIKAGQQRKAKAAVTRVLSSGWQVKAFLSKSTSKALKGKLS